MSTALAIGRNLARVVSRVQLVVLQKTTSGSFASHPYQTVRHQDLSPQLLEIYRQRNVGLCPERLRRRFNRGLTFYELRQDLDWVAGTWIVSGAERFIDEVGYTVDVLPSEIWVRDVFVREDMQGRGLFPILLDNVMSEYFPSAEKMWSDTDLNNLASVKAHKRYGFKEAFQLNATTLAGRVLLRTPPGQLRVSAYQPDRRVLWLGSDFRQFRDRHLA